jgi:hypothetical protein
MGLPIVPKNGTFTDHSGTVTSGGTSQQVMPANKARVSLFFQNLSSGDLWVDFGGNAVLSQPSIRVKSTDPPLVFERNFVPTGSVHVYGATTSQAFVAKEG